MVAARQTTPHQTENKIKYQQGTLEKLKKKFERKKLKKVRKESERRNIESERKKLTSTRLLEPQKTTHREKDPAATFFQSTQL